MKRVLLRLAAAFGVGLGVVVAVVYSLPDDVRPADCTSHLTRTTVRVTFSDGGHPPRCRDGYCGGRVALLRCPLPDAGTLEKLPDARVLSCLASVRWEGMPLQRADNCAKGTVQPLTSVEYVGDTHDTPDEGCDDEEACADGGGLTLADGLCAARGWPSAGSCTVDGQPAPYGTTLAAGTWSGAGCIPRVCVVFSTGGSGVDPGWPDDAPLQLGDGGLIPPRTESP